MNYDRANISVPNINTTSHVKRISCNDSALVYQNIPPTKPINNTEQDIVDTTETTVKPEIPMNILSEDMKVDRDLDAVLKSSKYFS